MAEYIERKVALAAIRERCAPCGEGIEALKSVPAADAAPVRHGKLISTGYDELYCEFGDCTVCGADNPTSNKFCGQCGAKMDREDD